MSVAEMKRAIRDDHAVTRDAEFLGNLMAKRDMKLLDFYLDSKAGVKGWIEYLGGVTYPRSPALVRNLLARGLDPNRPDWLGRTFLHACAENGDPTVAAVFLDAGANINSRDFEFQGTPLAAAVRCEPWCREQDRAKHAERQRRMIEFLLKRGAATNLAGDQPWATPLAWARKRKLKNIEAILIKHGAT
jgi:ankyrin repeat protein